MAEKMSVKFREMMQRKELLVIPGGYSPLHARMAQAIGFEAFFMAGSQTAAFIHGLPDVGIITMKDMVENGRRLAASCTIPIFADSDTGYGNAVNVYYTVQEFIRSGVAAIHIEDQDSPKKSGTSAGRSCISTEEAVGKYRAAVAARDALDKDFVIIARCDLIGTIGGTFDETVKRCIAYVEQGKVDAIWVNTLRTRDEIKEACRRIPAPVLAPYYGPPPSPTHSEYEDYGAAGVLYPSLTTAIGLQATWDFLHDFKEKGPSAMEEWSARATSSPWGVVPRHSAPLLDIDQIKAIEKDYLTQEKRPDYDRTFGHKTHS